MTCRTRVRIAAGHTATSVLDRRRCPRRDLATGHASSPTSRVTIPAPGRARRARSTLSDASALIDVDGDGELEILGKPWLGYDTLLTRANGEVLDGLNVPFMGLPC